MIVALINLTPHQKNHKANKTFKARQSNPRGF